MANHSSAQYEQQREAFLGQLNAAQERLRERGVDFRVIGSVASHAYLQELGGDNALPPLDYDRPGAATLDQRVPDIDMIVPRQDLSVARELRTQLGESDFPVKLGFAASTTEIDFRPGETHSYLTHKDIRVLVDNELLDVRTPTLDGVAVQTLPLDTLTHTYGVFGGKVRRKDMPVMKELIRAKTGPSDPRTEAFHQYHRERRRRSPGQYRVDRTIEYAKGAVSPRIRNELYKHALKAADLLGRR